MPYAGWVAPRGHRAWIMGLAVTLVAAMTPAVAQKAAAPAGTLKRIQQAGKIRFGYRVDARPFSYKDESGNAAGYSVAMCMKVADAVKAELAAPTLGVEWVPVSLEDRFNLLAQGKVDLLCGADTPTLARRKELAFSIPIFPGGIGALLRRDAPTHLQDVLMGRKSNEPTWRASAGQLLSAQTFAVVTGTTAQPWLAKKVTDFQLTAKVVPVDGYATGVQQVLDRQASVFFGDRAILLDAAVRNASAKDLVVLDRSFTYERLSLALARDEDFRLVVDRALSQVYASGDINGLYTKWFGAPDANAVNFFRWFTLPE